MAENRVCSVAGCGKKVAMGRTMCATHRSRIYSNGSTEPKPRPSLKDRFFSKVIKGDAKDDCWEWDGAKHGDGYGVINLGKRGMGLAKAHRVSYEMHVGSIPEGLIVRHKCDNPSCVNPNHLETGTAKDNTRDMITRGRAVPKRVKRNKLTSQMVIEMRNLYDAKSHRYTDLSNMFGVCVKTVQTVVLRKSWKSF